MNEQVNNQENNQVNNQVNNQANNQLPKKRFNIWILISILLIIGVIGYICYDKGIIKFNVNNSNQESSNETTVDTTGTTDDTTTTDTTKATETSAQKTVTSGNNTYLYIDKTKYVGDYINTVVYNTAKKSTSNNACQDPYTSNNTDTMIFQYNVEIPKILINTDTTKTINNKIISDYSDDINVATGKKNFDGFEGNISYNYYVYNNVLYLIVTSEGANECGSGSSSLRAYYYDIANDKELSLNDVLSKTGYTLNDVASGINKGCVGTGSEVCDGTTGNTVIKSTDELKYVAVYPTTVIGNTPSKTRMSVMFYEGYAKINWQI